MDIYPAKFSAYLPNLTFTPAEPLIEDIDLEDEAEAIEEATTRLREEEEAEDEETMEAVGEEIADGTGLCTSMGWSLQALYVSVYLEISMYECSVGVLQMVLNDSEVECGLESYELTNELFSYFQEELSTESVIFDSCNPVGAEDEEEEGAEEGDEENAEEEEEF